MLQFLGRLLHGMSLTNSVQCAAHRNSSYSRESQAS
jgi:hypothetical protein